MSKSTFQCLFMVWLFAIVFKESIIRIQNAIDSDRDKPDRLKLCVELLWVIASVTGLGLVYIKTGAVSDLFNA